MLDRRIAVIVPSTVYGNTPAPTALIEKWVKAAKVKMGSLFGGFTATPSKGGWVSAVHGVIEEDVMIVASFTDNDGIAKGLEDVRLFALTMAVAMSQEAVSVQIDNTLDFVSPAAVNAVAV